VAIFPPNPSGDMTVSFVYNITMKSQIINWGDTTKIPRPAKGFGNKTEFKSQGRETSQSSIKKKTNTPKKITREFLKKTVGK
jgi:hypothetical protein